jgi:uncharacterized protein
MNKIYNKKSWVSDKLEVRTSEISGSGVFTKDHILEGEIVIIWGGELVTVEEFNNGKGKKHTNVGIDEEYYLVTSDNDEMTIDDFMNHSCDPNLWLNDEVTLSARRDIRPNEELSFDYSIELIDEDYLMKQTCNCGAESCRKNITGKDWQLKELHEIYQNHFAPFILKRIKNLK